jgi:hypothetical protein
VGGRHATSLQELAAAPATVSIKEVKGPLMSLHDRLAIVFKRLLFRATPPSPSGSQLNLVLPVSHPSNPGGSSGGSGSSNSSNGASGPASGAELARSLTAVVEAAWPIWEQYACVHVHTTPLHRAG